MSEPKPRTIYSTTIVNGERVVIKETPGGRRSELRGEEIEIEAMRLARQAAEAAEEEQAAGRLTALQSAAESMLNQRYPRLLAVEVDGVWRYLRQDSADALPYPLRGPGIDSIIFGLNVVTAEQLAGIEANVNARTAAKMMGR